MDLLDGRFSQRLARTIISPAAATKPGGLHGGAGTPDGECWVKVILTMEAQSTSVACRHS
ncbi:MAG TPA: hypothetical protein VGN69_00345 [Solirubrobacteraceae bacterium]|jgi:hypothetical protein|nr:hypothetical protein [Solirubrobacteraceae bacterium]